MREGGRWESAGGNYDGEIAFLFSVPVILTLVVMLGFYLYDSGLYFVRRAYAKNKSRYNLRGAASTLKPAPTSAST